MGTGGPDPSDFRFLFRIEMRGRPGRHRGGGWVGTWVWAERETSETGGVK